MSSRNYNRRQNRSSRAKKNKHSAVGKNDDIVNGFQNYLLATNHSLAGKISNQELQTMLKDNFLHFSDLRQVYKEYRSNKIHTQYEHIVKDCERRKEMIYSVPVCDQIVWDEWNPKNHGTFFINKVKDAKGKFWTPKAHRPTHNTQLLSFEELYDTSGLISAVLMDSCTINGIKDYVYAFPSSAHITVVCPKTYVAVEYHQSEEYPLTVCPDHAPSAGMAKDVCPKAKVVTIVHPCQSGKFTTKAAVLRYADRCRFIVTSASLTRTSWKKATQYGWYIDLPIDKSSDDDVPTSEAAAAANTEGGDAGVAAHDDVTKPEETDAGDEAATGTSSAAADAKTTSGVTDTALGTSTDDSAATISSDITIGDIDILLAMKPSRDTGDEDETDTASAPSPPKEQAEESKAHKLPQFQTDLLLFFKCCRAPVQILDGVDFSQIADNVSLVTTLPGPPATGTFEQFAGVCKMEMILHPVQAYWTAVCSTPSSMIITTKLGSLEPNKRSAVERILDADRLFGNNLPDPNLKVVYPSTRHLQKWKNTDDGKAVVQIFQNRDLKFVFFPYLHNATTNDKQIIPCCNIITQHTDIITSVNEQEAAATGEPGASNTDDAGAKADNNEGGRSSPASSDGTGTRRLGWIHIGSQTASYGSWGMNISSLKNTRYELGVTIAPVAREGRVLHALDLTRITLPMNDVQIYQETDCPSTTPSEQYPLEARLCVGIPNFVHLEKKFMILEGFVTNIHPLYQYFRTFPNDSREVFLHFDKLHARGISVHDLSYETIVTFWTIYDTSKPVDTGRHPVNRVVSVHRSLDVLYEELNLDLSYNPCMLAEPVLLPTYGGATERHREQPRARPRFNTPMDKAYQRFVRDRGDSSEAFDRHWNDAWMRSWSYDFTGMRNMTDADVARAWPMAGMNCPDNLAWLGGHVTKRCGGVVPPMRGPYSLCYLDTITRQYRDAHFYM